LHLVYTWHRTRIKHIRLDLSAMSSNQALAHDRPN
jgi:predicted neuraminidase